jgi:nitrogen fixation protein FixH
MPPSLARAGNELEKNTMIPSVSLKNGAPRSAWRWFPWAMVGCLLVVVGVNGVLAWAALSSFPGKAVEDDFGASNRYDQVLAQAERQAALGWSVSATVDEGRPVLALAAKDGTPLENAEVVSVTQRPLGPPQTITQKLRAIAPGRYRADVALPQAGNWDMMLRVVSGGQTLAATRRVTVR